MHDLQRAYFNGPVTLEDAYITKSSSLSGEEAEKERERRRRTNSKAALPWSPPDRGSLLALGGILVSSVADSIPGISQLRHAKRLERELESTAEDEQDRYEAAKVVSLYRRELLTTTAAVIGGVGLMVGYMLHYGLLAPLFGGEGPQQPSYHGLARERGSRENEAESVEGDEPVAKTEPGPGLGQFGEAGAALEVLAQSWTQPQQPPAPVVEVDVEVDGPRV